MRTRVTLVAVMLLAGCGIFRRPDNQFYSLETIPPAGPVATASGTPIGIDGVELPPTLARRGIVIRDEEGKLEVRGTHQWAAPLEDMVLHTLSFDIANRLPDGMVILPGQARPTGAIRPLFVVFEDLSPGPDNVFRLDARWTFAGVTRHEQINIPLDSTDSPAIVTAMSRALAELSDRIVAAL